MTAKFHCVCPHCRDAFFAFQCPSCRHKNIIDACMECHNELVHGCVGPPVQSKPGHADTSSYQDRVYHGDNAPHDS